MVESTLLQPEPLYSLAFGSISGTYALVGTLVHPSRIYWVQNLTDKTLTFSQDGSTDHFVLASGDSIKLDVGSNRGIRDTLAFKAGTPLYVKGTGLGSGAAYLVSFYMTQKNY